MALYTGLQLSHPLAGVLCMSGYLPLSEPDSGLPGTFVPSAPALKTPVHMCHGKLDSMVRPAWAEHSEEVLTARGIQVDLNMYDDLEHSANLEEIEDVLAWVQGRLPAS